MLWRRLFVAFVFIGAALALYYYAMAPTKLRIAAGPESGPLYKHARFIADALASSNQPFRLQLVATPGMPETAAALDARRVDLAMLRSDDQASVEAQSVAIVQRQSLIVLAREDRGVERIEDMRGHKVAIVATGGESNKDVVTRLLSHFNIGVNDLELVEAPQADAGRGVTVGDYDAIILVLNVAGGRARRIVGMLLDRNPGMRFLSIGASEALAARFREVQAAEIPVGSFGGAPLQPPKALKSVEMTYELVARTGLEADVVSKFLRALMNVRSRLQVGQEREFVTETPDLDEARRFAPHAGTTDYVNNDTKTFLEIWSDAIWLGLFGLSLLGTSVTAVFGWLGVYEAPESAANLKDLPAIVAELEQARTAEDVRAVERKIDRAVEAFVRDAATGEYDLERLPDPSPMLRLLSDLAARRRAELAAPAGAAGESTVTA